MEFFSYVREFAEREDQNPDDESLSTSSSSVIHISVGSMVYQNRVAITNYPRELVMATVMDGWSSIQFLFAV